MVNKEGEAIAAHLLSDDSLRAGFVPLRQGGKQTPLFVAQGRNTGQIDLQDLNKYLSGAMPVYLLGRHAGRHAATREGQAASMLRTIRRIQPNGPYRLAGVGAFGILAYEIALQLLGQDQEVEFIGLLGPQPDLAADLPMPAAALSVHLFAPSEQAGWSGSLPGLQLAQQGPGLGARATVRALAAQLMALQAKPEIGRSRAPELDYQPHIVIQSGRQSPLNRHAPLFCIPGAGDSITGFAALAGALGPDWSVHGLQPRGVDGLMVPHASVEAAAAQCMSAIESVQGNGPVHLLGHSFGGWVAFHIAGLLQAANRPAASLTLIDSEAPGTQGTLGREYTPLEVMEQFIESLELVAERSLGLSSAALASLDDAGRLQQVFQAAVRVGLLPARARPQLLLGPLRTFGAALRTVYQPGPSCTVPARLVLVPDSRLPAQEVARKAAAMAQGWRQLLPQLSQWDGPGNHMTILRAPHVKALADWWLSDRSAAPASRPSTLNMVI
ncbi:alpha/beta fold hydrolase [Roseateles flavus]|uniref:Alpha/beta fold hydrolase n=1 Tax=Roseateles flavus TaxID=3149041 RepID=A0ABV0GL96_9BURK